MYELPKSTKDYFLSITKDVQIKTYMCVRACVLSRAHSSGSQGL